MLAFASACQNLMWAFGLVAYTHGHVHVYEQVDPLEIIAANKAVLGFNLIWLWDKVDEIGEMLRAMMRKVAWRKPLVGRTYGMAQLPEAVRFLQSGQSVGKVVIIVHPDE